MLFQSHNGAIAAAYTVFALARKARFQSHNGAIAASDLPASGDSVNNVSIPQWCDCCHASSPPTFTFTGSFQSHNGAIAAVITPEVIFVLQEFQSHNGAIAAWTVWESNLSLVRVSIPQWCDCCPSHQCPPRKTRKGFNPTMVRLLPPRYFV